LRQAAGSPGLLPGVRTRDCATKLGQPLGWPPTRQSHFRDYAAAILRFDTLVPESVVRYLQQEGLPATDVVSQVNQTVKEAWDQVVDTGAAESLAQSRR
jgi:hypothetical protein